MLDPRLRKQLVPKMIGERRYEPAFTRTAYLVAGNGVSLACLKLRNSVKCNPNWFFQPRAPAGSAGGTGGQWVAVGNPEVGREAGDSWIILAEDIAGFSKHGINRAISRGVGPEAILDAVKNPIRILPQPNGTARYVGRRAVVVLNPAGKVVTIWGH